MRKIQGGDDVRRRRKTHLVSVSLDTVTWGALREIAASQARSVDDLIVEIAADSLGLALHIYVVEFYRTATAGPKEPEQVFSARASSGRERRAARRRRD
jgi:predicted DNA-binding ribbon-helix-helix protein